MNETHEKEVLLSVKNIGVTFGRGRYAFHAVRDVSFDIYRGETFGVVGRKRFRQDDDRTLHHAHTADYDG